MIKILDAFCEIPCLTERSTILYGSELQKKWFKSADKRRMGLYLQKFIDYNSDLFRFLGIVPIISGSDQNTSISFRTSEFIGAIPLRASDSGKQIGDMIVVPRYTGRDKFKDYIDILNLLDKEISPITISSLPLVSGKNYHPPLYLEALKYISSLEKLVNNRWKKFDSIIKTTHEPIGTVLWNKYIQNEFKVEKRLLFPIRKNVLSEFHKEYCQLRYVFDICINELLSQNTPLIIKSQVRSKLLNLQEKLYFHKPLYIHHFTIKASDSPVVANCKHLANHILSYHLTDSTAWRVDFSDVFEKFVQYVFKETSKELGGRFIPNYKFHSRSFKSYAWELKHLEPDGIYQKDNLVIFIDAKYKSNLYNKYIVSDILKEDYRHDLHQVLAYTSFSRTRKKFCALCYPSQIIEFKEIEYKNDINDARNSVFILGIPLNKASIQEIKKMLLSIFNGIETNPVD